MDTPAPATGPLTTPSSQALNWDDIFPWVNRAVLCLVLIFGLLFATGMDVTQLGAKLFPGETAAASVVASSSAEPAVESTGFSLSITGPGGWKHAIVLVTAIFGITIIALSFLSGNGRDAAWTKEQEAKKREESKPAKPATAANAGAPATEPEECNLASYKLFFGSESADKPAATTTV